MHLASLTVDGFRNLQNIELLPHRRLTIVVGENGVGKTNLLEAVHLVAALRPLRPTERARDLVAFDRDQGAVRGTFDLDGPLPVEVLLEQRGRKATMAGKAVRDLSQVAARIGVVSFTPEDIAIVRAGPDRRRRELDRFAFGLSPAHADLARRFDAALDRRNRLLKGHSVDPQLLEAYSEPLIEAGADLILARLQACEVWAPGFIEAARAITDQRGQAGLAYRSSLADEARGSAGGLPDRDKLVAVYRERLASQAEGERARRTTLAGPHLDDVDVELHERRARHLASQGEARALVLALKIAAVRIYAEVRDAPPLLLLDDVAGELDPNRARCLFDVVDEVGAQTFVTTTHVDALPSPGEALVVHVEAGRIARREALPA